MYDQDTAVSATRRPISDSIQPLRGSDGRQNLIVPPLFQIIDKAVGMSHEFGEFPEPAYDLIPTYIIKGSGLRSLPIVRHGFEETARY